MELLAIADTGGGYEIVYAHITDKEGLVRNKISLAELENFEQLLISVRSRLVTVR